MPPPTPKKVRKSTTTTSKLPTPKLDAALTVRDLELCMNSVRMFMDTIDSRLRVCEKQIEQNSKHSKQPSPLNVKIPDTNVIHEFELTTVDTVSIDYPISPLVEPARIHCSVPDDHTSRDEFPTDDLTPSEDSVPAPLTDDSVVDDSVVEYLVAEYPVLDDLVSSHESITDSPHSHDAIKKIKYDYMDELKSRQLHRLSDNHTTNLDVRF